MRIDEDESLLSDGYETITADRRLVPVGCVRGGEWILATAGQPHAVAA
jgi:dihydroorotase